MKTKVLLSLFLAVTVLAISYSCSKMEKDLIPQTVSLQLPEIPFDYSTIQGANVTMLPGGLTGVDNNIATLGRVLFYDKNLSVNNAISCGSCHKQSIAFSDNVDFSPGFQNHSTLRNTLPIQNISNTFVLNSFQQFGNPSLFWDGRADFLQTMVLMPIVNHVEMGMNDQNGIVEKVKSKSYYKNLFIKAYASSEINIENISQALSSFVSSIFSANTRFDKYQMGQTQLNGLEEQGRLLFFNKYNCNSCHQTQQLNGYQMGGGFVNIGLESNYIDKGFENVSHNTADNGKFKIPNLRNITLTGPYMHDGRFKTLNEVLDHYSHGIANSPALDVRLRASNGQPMKMNITDQEKTAIIAFLNTLTDYTMITDQKYSNPFKAQ